MPTLYSCKVSQPPPPPPDPHLRPLSLPSLATLTSASCVITGSQAMWCPMQPVVHTYVTLIHREVDSGTGFSDGQPTRPDENKEADSRTPPCGLSTTSQLSTTFVACTATVLISVDIAGVLSSSNSCRWAVTKPCRWGIRVVPSSPSHLVTLSLTLQRSARVSYWRTRLWIIAQ